MALQRRDTGLLRYWNEFGWPKVCRPLEADAFTCDAWPPELRSGT